MKSTKFHNSEVNVKMKLVKKFKQMISKNDGYVEWEDYNRLIKNKDWLEFMSKTTFQNADRLLEKGL